MATGGSDRSVDSLITCSICLEPYRGRQPKLLPCSHTFCFPCLTQIADKERKRLRQMTGEEKDDVIITCPTCRSPVTLPPTGVAGLLTNVYLGDFGNDSGSGYQLHMMESFLKTMRETEKRSSQQQLTAIHTGTEDDPQHEQSTNNLESKVDLLTSMVTSLYNQNTLLRRDLTSLHEKHDREMKSLLDTSKKDRDALTSLQEKHDREMKSLLDTSKKERDSVTSLHEKHDREMKSLLDTSKKDRDAVTSLQEKHDREMKSLLDASKKDRDAVTSLHEKHDREMKSLLDTSKKDRDAVTSLHEKHDREMKSLLDTSKKDRDSVTSLQEKHDREMKSLLDASKKDRAAVTSLEREVDKLRNKNAFLRHDKEQMRNEVTQLQRDVTEIRDYQYASLCRNVVTLHEKHDREITSLKDANKKNRDAVEREVAKLRNKNAFLRHDKELLTVEVIELQRDVTLIRDYVRTLQGELDKLNQGAVQSDIAALGAERGKDQAELNTLKTELYNPMTELNTPNANLKAEQGKVQGAQNTTPKSTVADWRKTKQGKLQTDLKKAESGYQQGTVQLEVLKKQVAFQTWLFGSVTLKDGDRLICNEVITSVGGGYDNKTGVFTVPVSGLYCFVFTTRCAEEDLEEWCKLCIMLEKLDIAYLWAYGKTYSTAHTVVHVTAGQKVYIRSCKNNNKILGSIIKTTAFTGFLVQPGFKAC